MFLLAFCNSKVIAFAAVFVGSFVVIIFPSIAAIKSAYVSKQEQGAVQGALGAAQALSLGIGPFIFLAVFYFFRRGDLYFAGAPYVLAGICLLAGTILACLIKLPPIYRELSEEDVYDVEDSHNLANASVLNKDMGTNDLL